MTAMAAQQLVDHESAVRNDTACLCVVIAGNWKAIILYSVYRQNDIKDASL